MVAPHGFDGSPRRSNLSRCGLSHPPQSFEDRLSVPKSAQHPCSAHNLPLQSKIGQLSCPLIAGMCRDRPAPGIDRRPGGRVGVRRRGVRLPLEPRYPILRCDPCPIREMGSRASDAAQWSGGSRLRVLPNASPRAPTCAQKAGDGDACPDLIPLGKATRFSPEGARP